MTISALFVSQLNRALDRLKLSGERVLVAVSGGPDSVALLRGLLELRQSRQLDLIVAHFNHGYRGAEADADAAWVQALAERFALPCVVGAASTLPASSRPASTTGSTTTASVTSPPPVAAAVAVSTHHSAATFSEAAARDARYAFLTTTAETAQATAVALGHQQDDLVETVLHHLFRGTGLVGAAGIPSVRELTPAVRLVRPLLDLPRQAVRAALEDWGQDFRQDATNADARWTRNFWREELLPHLRARYPAADRHVLSFARHAAEAVAILDRLASELLTRVTLDRGPVVRLRLEPLQTAERLLVTHALGLLWEQAGWPRQALTASHWEQAWDVITGDLPATQFPGAIDIRRRAGILVITPGQSGSMAD